jgi:hypothetical protein
MSCSSITKCSSSRVKVTPSREARHLDTCTSVHTSEQSPNHFFFIYTLFPLFIPFTLDKNQSSYSNSKNTNNHVLRWERWFPHKSTMTSIKKLPMMSITHSTTWLVILADQTFGYTTIIQYFMFTNHPIMFGHFLPSNLIRKRIKATNLKVILLLLHCRQFQLFHDLSSPSLGLCPTPHIRISLQEKTRCD